MGGNIDDYRFEDKIMDNILNISTHAERRLVNISAYDLFLMQNHLTVYVFEIRKFDIFAEKSLITSLKSKLQQFQKLKF